MIDPRDNPNVTTPVGTLSWALGATITEPPVTTENPIPTSSDGMLWRQIELDPGVYVIQTTGIARVGPGDAAITRTFLDDAPVFDANGYVVVPRMDGATFSASTVVEVEGSSKTLTQRVVNDGQDVGFLDNALFTLVELTK